MAASRKGQRPQQQQQQLQQDKAKHNQHQPQAKAANEHGSSELDMDEMQMAIAALSSLKESSVSGSAQERSTSEVTPSRDGRAKPTGISIPPISTPFTDGKADNQQYHHVGRNGAAPTNGGGLQYSYVSAETGRGNGASNGYGYGNTVYHPDSSASTSTYTHSPVTTPSVRTTTSLSSPGSPDLHERSPFFGHDRTQASLEASSSNAIIPTQSDPSEDGFIGRVSQLPLVSGALRVYERGRNSSRVVKYSTDLVETSVKTLSKPVINRVVGPNLVGQIDDFACRQLDRFGTRPTPSPGVTAPPDSSGSGIESSPFDTDLGTPSNEHAPSHALLDLNQDGFTGYPQDSPSNAHAGIAEGFSPKLTHADLPPIDHSGTRSSLIRADPGTRSRWQSLVIEAGVTAGGIGAAVSEESMKSLKYCLHWLHYATAHLDHQAGILREFILSLSSQRASSALIRGEDARAASILDGIKRDVVETIRKVVDVVSTYAGAALPEQARRYVRSSILGLPEKWARAMQGQQSTDLTSGTEPTVSQSADMAAAPADGVTQRAAERTLTFAVESLDMLRGLLGIFNDSVERADAWVERLRLVGLQRQYGREEAAARTTQRLPPVDVFDGDHHETRLGKVSGLRQRFGDGDDHDLRRRHAHLDDETPQAHAYDGQEDATSRMEVDGENNE